jgi:hypothetical protein
MPPVLANSDTLPNLETTNSPILYFYFRPQEGNEVKVPADFLPPFLRGELPDGLKMQILNARPQDADALLGVMWNYYAQMQAMKQAKEKAELERIASGNPVLISEESIPPEFRQGVPMDLAIRLSGLHKASDIVAEMLAYKSEHQNLQSSTMPPDPLAELRATLKQAGVPDSALPRIPGINPMPNIPAPFAAMRQSGNEQAMAIAEQMMRPQQQNMNPGFVLPYQVVPASAAAGNPAVENPMPSFGSSPNSLLTPLPQKPITVP